MAEILMPHEWLWHCSCQKCSVKKKAKNRAYYLANRERIAAQSREYKKHIPRHVLRSRKLKHRYGITLDDYERMAQEQNGCCLLCGRKEKLFVDHDHETRKVRGLLCNNCNFLVGHVENLGVDIISKVGKYLGRNT